jgi:5-dehydro-2-deoxygluconokinase
MGLKPIPATDTCSLPNCPVKVVSTIGAEDGFAAGFLYGLVRGLRLGECLRYGNAGAAIVVSRVSCSDAMPYLKELNAFLASNTGGQEVPVEAPRLAERP